MTDISGKSMEEIYREEARRYKESIEKERLYSESEDILTGNFDKSESLTVTMPMEEFDKLEKLALSAHTDKLSVEKLQEIRVEELKDFNSKILQAELKNQKLQKEIDAAKKYIEESYKADKEDNKLLDLIIEAVAKLKSDNETLKKALTESEKMYQKQMDRFLNSEMNESARSHCESQLKLLFPAHKAYEALAAIGWDDD